MQPETEAEARGWFQKAANDLRGADIDLAANPPLIEDALFQVLSQILDRDEKISIACLPYAARA